MIFRQRDPNQDQDVSMQSTEDASITRNFRYMRRKPTIISYQPPPGDLDEDGNQLPQLSDIVVDSDHMILDRIQGKFISYQPFILYQTPPCDLDEASVGIFSGTFPILKSQDFWTSLVPGRRDDGTFKVSRSCPV